MMFGGGANQIIFILRRCPGLTNGTRGTPLSNGTMIIRCSSIWKMSNRFPGSCFVYVHDGSATEIDAVADQPHVALICNDPGAIYCQGHREGLSEVI